MNRNMALTIAAILVVVIYALTESPIILSIITVFAMVLMVPTSWFRKLGGYVVAVDVLASAYIFSMFVGTGTLGALPLAAFSAFFISITLRLIRMKVGAERLAVNGNTEFRLVFAELATHTIAWSKALMKGATTGKVDAPKPLNLEWVETQEEHSLGYMIAQLFVSPPKTC